jgi:general secretion pathway protein A
MYETFFGLSGLPFQLSPDPSFYFESRGHREALAALRQGLAQGATLMVISGEVGAGKTTLLRILLESVDRAAVEMVHISGTLLNAQTLSDTLSISLGVLPAADPNNRRDALLAKLVMGARPTLLLIDEAQHLENSAFELLETLAQAAAAAGALLQMCLVGQPELRGSLQGTEQTRFRERIQVDRHLGALDRQETRSYVEHRLHKVGWTGQPQFDDEAFGEIFDCTSGIPRRLNLLCNRLLLSAFLGPQPRIGATTVANVAAELRAEFGSTVQASVRSEPARDKAAHDADVPRRRAFDVLSVPGGGVQEPAVVPGAQVQGALLCVAAGQGDHVQIAALMRALHAHASLPPARLVSAFSNDALALNRELFAGLDADDRSPLSVDLAAVPHEERTAELALRFESMVDQHRPSAVVVCNGSETALACGRVAHHKGVRVVHIGGGQRSEHRSTPEDFTRMLTDRLSDMVLTSEPESAQGLVDEGIPQARIHCVGNLAMDALRAALRSLLAGGQEPALGLVPPEFLNNRGGYGLVGLSAATNIHDRAQLHALLSLLTSVSRGLPLLWPVNKLTHGCAEAFGLTGLIEGERIACVPTQTHSAFIDLMRNATCVLTDSWCMQDEAVALDVPCLMLGEQAERVRSALTGTALCVGTSRPAANRAVWDIVYNGRRIARLPQAWDGRSAERIAALLEQEWERRRRSLSVTSI